MKEERQVEMPADIPGLREGMIGGQCRPTSVDVSLMLEETALQQVLHETVVNWSTELAELVPIE